MRVYDLGAKPRGGLEHRLSVDPAQDHSPRGPGPADLVAVALHNLHRVPAAAQQGRELSYRPFLATLVAVAVVQDENTHKTASATQHGPSTS